jgi:hypothetical protein
MGFFNLFKKSKPKSEPENIEKATIATPKMEQPVNYESQLDNIKAYFGKLSTKEIQDNSYSYNTLHTSVSAGVYYGVTKYTGQTNRNGVKEVALSLPDNSILISLDRKLWKRYDTEVGVDGVKWFGYSDGESVRVTVFKDKVSESFVKSQLSSCGRWIRDVEFATSLYKRAEKLDLPNDEFEYNKAQSTEGYDYYYIGKYMLAGVDKYVTGAFVSYGLAKQEPDNSYNDKAVVIYTDGGIKVGYIYNKELAAYYNETKGINDIPVVVEAHIYNGKLYGNVYTFTKNAGEYHYMRNQFIKLLNL